MVTRIITFNPDATGTTGILDYREESDEYAPGAGEVELPADIDQRELSQYLVDASADPPALVDNPDWSPPPTVDSVADRVGGLDSRINTLQNSPPNQIPESLKQAYRDATTDKGRTDVLFEMLTGEPPDQSPS